MQQANACAVKKGYYESLPQYEAPGPFEAWNIYDRRTEVKIVSMPFVNEIGRREEYLSRTMRLLGSTDPEDQDKRP